MPTANSVDTILHGDALVMLQTLPDGCVQTCVTSPPYWNLRDYGVAGQIGLESTPDAYVARLVEVFREVRRVLRPDGTLWLNIGDSYAANMPRGTGRRSGTHGLCAVDSVAKPARQVSPTMKPKDLVGIPWMLAFALRADGWWLRSDVIWHKPNCMPSSVRDRPTSSHEHLFLLTKSQRYFYDADSIREPHTMTPQRRLTQRHSARDAAMRADKRYPYAISTTPYQAGNPAGRNKRDVWSINTKPYKGAHFAVMPPSLVEPCVLAGSSPQACEHCGAPWQCATERQKHPSRDSEAQRAVAAARTGRSDGHTPGPSGKLDVVHSIGWRPSCRCQHNSGADRCVVLDPFGGSGTVGAVAKALGRHYLLIDLNPAYCDLATDRIAHVHQPSLWTPEAA